MKKPQFVLVAVAALLMFAAIVYTAWRQTRPSPMHFAYVTSITDVPNIPSQILGIPLEGKVLAAQQGEGLDRYTKTWLFGRLSRPMDHTVIEPEGMSYQETIKKDGRYDNLMKNVIRSGNADFKVPTLEYGRECIVRSYLFRRGHYCIFYYEENTRRFFAWIIVNRWLRSDPGDLTIGKSELFNRRVR